jgi:hypothetical protein
MEKKELLEFCRYYKGENINPFVNEDSNMLLLWHYEKSWIAHCLTENGSKTLVEYINEYTAVGLSTFEASDSIPLSYKAMLFNRYAKTYYSLISAVQSFKKFYLKYYK